MEKQVIIGRSNPSGENVAIGVNARARSTYVIGITETGKSTVLESMAYQDMANRDGLCFLDPHGDSAKKLLASVPDYREPDVKQRKRLQQSWAGTFRREVFARLDESPFAVLYADAPSRPNIPVNVLVGLETLKAGHGWSDEEMHDEFFFGLQVRYALGYENLGEGEFDVRTLYNFRHRLNDHMCRTGENLVDHTFRQITDAQVKAFQLKTGRLRMDTTQIASNIRRMSRIHLLVEVLQRAHRMLNQTDQTHYAQACAPYLQGSSGQYVYHLKGEETSPHLQRIGELMHRLLVELAPTYGFEFRLKIAVGDP